MRRGSGDAYAEYDAAHAGRPLELVYFRDMQPQFAGLWLIKGVLQREQISLIVGPTQSGKTFLALDLALHVAAGLAWCGRKITEGPVIYVAAEGGRGIINRVCAWKFANGYDIDAEIPFAIVTTAVDLCHADSGDLDQLIVAIKAARFSGRPPVLIVIDTVSRVLAGGNENSPDDMGAVVHSLDRLRDEFHCHVSAVHHFGKDSTRGARGHNSLTANLDTVVEVEKDVSGSSTATLTKQRDGPIGANVSFRLRQVELGRDEDDLDHPVTSCVVETVEAGEPIRRKSASPKLSHASKIALDHLRKAIADAGETPPASNHIPAGVRAVSEDLWRRYCYAGQISTSDKPDAKRQAFGRAAEALIAAKAVTKWDSWVWPS